MIENAANDLPDAVRRELRRVTDRLATMSDHRLETPGADGTTPPEAAFEVARNLAGLAARLETLQQLSALRELPKLPPRAASSALTVTAHDVLRAAEAAGEESEAFTALQATLSDLTELRRRF